MNTGVKNMYSKRLVFWSACLGMLLFGIALIVLGSVLPDLMQKYSLDAVAAGTLFSILPFGILTGSLLFGPVCDRYGYRLLLSVSALILFVGLEGLAYSPSPALLNLFIFLVGLSGGALNGATNAVVADISTSSKGADLSLLGVFFGVGALGMPILLGVLEKSMKFDSIIALTGFISLLAAILFLAVTFPVPRQSGGFQFSKVTSLLKDGALMLIAFFLFFQSSFESLINNWSVSYIIERYGVPQSRALFALSCYVAGMMVMRLLLGTLFRNVPEKRLMPPLFVITAAALILIMAGRSYFSAAAGLALLGAGLAGGFPVMLGLAGNRYPELPGTVFSLVFFIALTGNMSVNYSMGFITQKYGIGQLTVIQSAELIIMAALSIIIFRKIIRTNK